MKRTFEETVQEVLKKHDGVFKTLVISENVDKLDLLPREKELAYHILLNREELEQEIVAGHNTHFEKLPSHLPELYLDQYKARALQIIKKHLEQFNLNPEESFQINEEFINKTMGNSMLRPPR